MKFLDGYKTLVGVLGALCYAFARVMVVDVCHRTFLESLEGHGLDLAGGVSVALLILGLIHKAEKRRQP